jgi:repressor LexA
MKNLTERQSDILQYIMRFIESAGYPPTYREIGLNFDMNSINSVQCHLNCIERKGYIARDGNGGSRAIAVLKGLNGEDVRLGFYTEDTEGEGNDRARND